MNPKLQATIQYVTGAIVGLCLILIFVLLDKALFDPAIFASTQDKQVASSTLERQVMGTTTAALPVRITIPNINVDANVQKALITYKGNIGIPTNFSDAAWYAYSPRPGEPGNAIIDGHVDNGLSLPGVFKDLDNLQPGNTIMIRSQDGTTYTYTVKDVMQYPYNDPPPSFLFRTTGTSTLSLITCTGTWVQADKTYDHRIIVETTLTNIGYNG